MQTFLKLIFLLSAFVLIMSIFGIINAAFFAPALVKFFVAAGTNSLLSSAITAVFIFKLDEETDEETK
jgi:hypothetical protein